MRLSVIGGGGFRVPLVYRALLADPTSTVGEFVLYDVDERRLAVIAQVLAQQAHGHSRPPVVSATTDLGQALAEASFVFHAVRVGGLRGRVRDERTAVAAGLLGQETVGAGGVCFGLRTVPVALALAERVAAVAPRAWVVNLTNPAGLVTEAMARVLGDRVIGVCDSPAGLCRRVADALGAPPERASFDYVGVNHLGWLRRVLVDDVDLLPGLLADPVAAERVEEVRLSGYEQTRSLGMVPNEYNHYYAVRPPAPPSTTRGEALLRQQERFYRAVEAEPGLALARWDEARYARDASYLAESRAMVGAGPRRREDIEAGGYERVALSLVHALTTGEPAELILNVRNGKAVPGLPVDAVVEVSCRVDGDDARPVPGAALPPPQLRQLQQVKAVDELVLAAARTGSRQLAGRALAEHPLVGSTDAACRILAARPDLFADLA